MLLTLGLTLVIAPNILTVSDAAIALDLPFMVAVSIACIPIFIAGFNLTRMDGSIFLFYYITYLTYLVLAALGSPVAESLQTVMAFVVIPLTVVYMIWRIFEYRKSISKG
jgi:cation:H+ antiporter